MSRPDLPSRSRSRKTMDPPHDASKPDAAAVTDVYREVAEMGSLELAGEKLRQVALERQREEEEEEAEQERLKEEYRKKQELARRVWEEDPEEAEYVAQQQQRFADGEDMEYEEDGGDGRVQGAHMQQVIEGLWIGDLVAAMDQEALAEQGITNILSLLRPKLEFSENFAVYPLEIDDAPDTDILSHLPSCVAWIQSALDRRSSPDGSGPSTPGEVEKKVNDRRAPGPKAGSVLVHCQAGMSRSATVVAAYLMRRFECEPVDALEMIRKVRSQVDPSDTFWYQLALFYNADGRVSLKDRQTRQFYMERTTSSFMNGGGAAVEMNKMAKYPISPSASSPQTPAGALGRRKIRCKMCRRQLAVREHMMDHILDQAPVSRPRTPSIVTLPSPRGSISHYPGNTERRASVVSDVINPLTGLPGASRSRHSSMSYGGSSLQSMTAMERTLSESEYNRHRSGSTASIGAPPPRKSDLKLTSMSPTQPLPLNPIDGGQRSSGPSSPIVGKDSRRRSSAPGDRPYQTADQLSSRLPPHLQALRAAGGGSSALPSPLVDSPASSPEGEVPPSLNTNGQSSFGSTSNGNVSSMSSMSSSGSASSAGATVSRKLSTKLLMTPTAGRDRRGSTKDEYGVGGVIATSGPPILANPKCSGYFVEPLTWMEPVLKDGAISGKLVCPNEKCGVKIGNFDWAGVQCGCKEWVTPVCVTLCG